MNMMLSWYCCANCRGLGELGVSSVYGGCLSPLPDLSLVASIFANNNFLVIPYAY